MNTKQIRISDWASDVAQENNVPLWKVMQLFNAIHEFNSLDETKNIIEKGLIGRGK